MSRIPFGKTFRATFTALLGVALFACASLGDDAFSPQVGEMSIVFPQNDTYAVVSPFPVIFGYQNAAALLSYDSELRWSIECGKGSLYASDTINGYDYAQVPAGDYYVFNSSKTLQEALPSGSQDPKGPYGRWYGTEDECTLSWKFFYWTVCTKQPNGATLIQAGVGTRSGKVYFKTRPGAQTPKDAIANYQGCASKGTIEKVTNSSTSCPDLLAQPDAQPCKLAVKAVASSLAAAAVSPTTTFLGVSTSTQATTTSKSTSTSSATPSGTGGGSSSNDPGKKSRASSLGWSSQLIWAVPAAFLLF